MDSDHWYCIEPEACVKATVKQLGKATYTIGHWKHAIKVFLILLMPRCCVRKSTFQKFVDLRAKANEPKVVNP